jgi:hypothetical protein
MAENLRQLPMIFAICNAATFEGSPSDLKWNIIGNATGKAIGAWSAKKHFVFSQLSLLQWTRFDNPQVPGYPYFQWYHSCAVASCTQDPFQL